MVSSAELTYRENVTKNTLFKARFFKVVVGGGLLLLIVAWAARFVVADVNNVSLHEKRIYNFSVKTSNHQSRADEADLRQTVTRKYRITLEGQSGNAISEADTVNYLLDHKSTVIVTKTVKNGKLESLKTREGKKIEDIEISIVLDDSRKIKKIQGLDKVNKEYVGSLVMPALEMTFLGEAGSSIRNKVEEKSTMKLSGVTNGIASKENGALRIGKYKVNVDGKTAVFTSSTSQHSKKFVILLEHGGIIAKAYVERNLVSPRGRRRIGRRISSNLVLDPDKLDVNGDRNGGADQDRDGS